MEAFNYSPGGDKPQEPHLRLVGSVVVDQIDVHKAWEEMFLSREGLLNAMVQNLDDFEYKEKMELFDVLRGFVARTKSLTEEEVKAELAREGRAWSFSSALVSKAQSRAEFLASTPDIVHCAGDSFELLFDALSARIPFVLEEFKADYYTDRQKLEQALHQAGAEVEELGLDRESLEALEQRYRELVLYTQLKNYLLDAFPYDTELLELSSDVLLQKHMKGLASGDLRRQVFKALERLHLAQSRLEGYGASFEVHFKAHFQTYGDLVCAAEHYMAANRIGFHSFTN